MWPPGMCGRGDKDKNDMCVCVLYVNGGGGRMAAVTICSAITCAVSLDDESHGTSAI